MDKKIIKQKTVVAQVMEELKELIAQGRFKPIAMPSARKASGEQSTSTR